MVREYSLRKKVYSLWVENPYLVAKNICKKLDLNYKTRGNYINKLLSEFRSYHNFGSPLKAHVPHRRVFVWECVPRPVGVEMPLFVWRVGWRLVSNRNEMWVFRGDLGSVHWYKGGLVRLYLRGAVQLARAKELFCRAFSWFSSDEWSRFLDVALREESKHWVFDLGSPVPRFDIRQFERTHGIRIFADKSHPTGIEVEETQPFWLGEFRQTTELFGEEIKAHIELIDEWRKEAKIKRKKKPGVLRRVKDWLW